MSSESSDRFRYLASQLDDPLRPWHVVVACLIIVVIGVVLYFRVGSGLLQFKPDLDTGIGVALLSLVILVASVEIAAATIVDIFRAKGHSEWSVRVRRVSERLSEEGPTEDVLRRAYQREKCFVQSLYDNEVIPIPVPDLESKEQNCNGYRSWLEIAGGIYTFALVRHAAITRVHVGYVVFLAGFLLAVGGVSIFSFVFRGRGGQ